MSQLPLGFALGIEARCRSLVERWKVENLNLPIYKYNNPVLTNEYQEEAILLLFLKLISVLLKKFTGANLLKRKSK